MTYDTVPYHFPVTHRGTLHGAAHRALKMVFADPGTASSAAQRIHFTQA